jgi:hypothetical protein
MWRICMRSGKRAQFMNQRSSPAWPWSLAAHQIGLICMLRLVDGKAS